MSESIIISSINYDGEQAQILFKPDNVITTINLGTVTLPYTFTPTPPREVFGDYTILINNSDCPNFLNVIRPTPTPTPTPTLTKTPTNTPTPTLTPTLTLNPCFITPTPTNTVTPTNTITPTMTNTQTPSSTPSICFKQMSDWWKFNSYYSYSALTNEYRYNFIPATNNIQNGGFNMFNYGNYIFITTSYPKTYGTIGSNYFITNPNVWPQLTMIKYGIGTSTHDIQIYGTPGSGTRQIELDNGTYSCGNIFGDWFSYTNHSSVSPSIIYVWFIVKNNSWGSDVVKITDGRTISNPNTILESISVTGHNIFLGMTLLSKHNDNPNTFTNQEITNFLESSICHLFTDIQCASF
jgi:hypothetical protein